MPTRPLLAFLFSILCGTSLVALAQSYLSHDMHQMMLNAAREVQGFKPTADVDRDFAVMMAHQHKTSVRIAEHEMKHGKDPKVKEIARRIVEAQQKDMQELEAWLSSRSK